VTSGVRALGVITARGGSKGLPGKNLKPLAGKPLLVHTIEAARASAAFDRVVLSTDDDAIAACGREAGCEVPFHRPSSLAQDDTPHLPVLRHAVQWLADHEDYHPDVVVILQPTSPLRRPEDIRAAIDLLVGHDVDSVLSVSAVPAHMNPMRMLRVDDAGRATLFVTGEPVRCRINRRQDMPDAWVINGALYAFRPAVLFAPEPSLYGDRTLALPLPDPYGLSIDTAEDWAHAEQAFGEHHGS
jgi:CMP-N,N'-diacetyllegionaminic acid synthase